MKDRGLVKWNGFIMPEQKELIKQVYVESLKIKKPTLDQGQQYHEMNDLLIRSMLDHEPIELTLWIDGFIKDFGPVTIHKIDPHQRTLYVHYKDSKQIFHLDSLIGVKTF